MLKHSLIAAAVALFAAGCTMAPKYERPAAPVDQTFPTGGVYDKQPDTASSSSPSGSAQDKPAVDIGWRDFFVDARLQQIVAIALKNNRDLRVSMLNVAAARSQYQITRAELLPTLDAVGSQSKQRTPKDLSLFGQTLSTSYSVGVNASWEIDFFGRIQSLKDQALEQYFALAETRKAAEISLVSQVADQYLTMLSDDDQLTVTRNTLKTADESYRITKLQFDNGVGTELDVRQAQGIQQQAAANLQSQLRLRAQAENALVLLIGEPLPADLPPGLPLDSQNLLTDIPAELPSDLLIRRPDIASAEHSLLAANANIGAARAAFFPKISLTGSFGTLAPSLGTLFAGFGGMVVRSANLDSNFRGRHESGQSGSGSDPEAHRDRELREGDPDGVPRSSGRAGRARHLRRADQGARVVCEVAGSRAGAVGSAISQRRGQLSERADGPDQPVHRAAVADHGAAEPGDESRRFVS